jgi:hypothetical protein
VVKLEHNEGEPQVTVDFAGRNSRGVHVSGAAVLALAR